MTRPPTRAARAAAWLLMVLSVGDLSCAVGERTPVRDEAAVIDAVLKHLWAGSKYTVVKPDTSFYRYEMQDPKQLEQSRHYLAQNLRVEGLDIAPLIDALFAVNRTPIRLRLESTREKGYLVDFKGEYRGYFKQEGVGWAAWHRDHPHADGITEVSRPAYDDRIGIILIYVGTQMDWKAGEGKVILFKCEGESLKELARVTIWVS